MKNQAPRLPLLQRLHQLTERLHEINDPRERHELLKEMRLVLSDADKIVGSEVAEDEQRRAETLPTAN